MPFACLYRAPQPILANDVHPGAYALAHKDAAAAGVADDIEFSNLDVEDYRCVRARVLCTQFSLAAVRDPFLDS